MEREHLALYRKQAERVEQSIQTQELAVARQRTAMRIGYLLIAVVLLLLAPLVVWILWKL